MSCPVMVLVSVLATLTSSYLAWSSWPGLTVVVVTAGTSLSVCLQWPVLGPILTVSTATVLAILSQRAVSRGSLVYLRSDQVSPSEDLHITLTRTIEAIIRSCPSLKTPQYIPTFWSSNQWANLALYFLKQLYDKSSWRSNNFSREVLSLPDGGTVSIDFAEDSHLPPGSPVVLFLHTITGSGLVSGLRPDSVS